MWSLLPLILHKAVASAEKCMPCLQGCCRPTVILSDMACVPFLQPGDFLFGIIMILSFFFFSSFLPKECIVFQL